MGGVIYFDMLYIPPQPKKVAQWVICELEHPQVEEMGSSVRSVNWNTHK
jgi:hypothetical protein